MSSKPTVTILILFVLASLSVAEVPRGTKVEMVTDITRIPLRGLKWVPELQELWSYHDGFMAKYKMSEVSARLVHIWPLDTPPVPETNPIDTNTPAMGAPLPGSNLISFTVPNQTIQIRTNRDGTITIRARVR